MTATVPNLEVLSDRSFALGAPTYVDNIVLVANTAQTITVPTGATVGIFSANGDFYVNWTTAASVPSVNVTGGGGQELNPTVRYLARVTGSISMVAPAGTIVSIAWFVNL